MVDVGDTCHHNKRQVVQEPSNDGVQTSVVNVINFSLVELLEAPLPAQNVPSDSEAKDAQGKSRPPIHEGVAKKEVLDDVVIPPAHAQSDVQNRPLPPLRGQVILLVRIRDQGVVRGHHGNIQVNEVVQEGRLVLAWISRRQFLVYVRLDIPVRVGITRVVVLSTGNLNLPETPLRQVDITSSQVTTKDLMFQTECGREGPNSASVLGGNISNNFDLPVVFIITDSQIAVG